MHDDWRQLIIVYLSDKGDLKTRLGIQLKFKEN